MQLTQKLLRYLNGVFDKDARAFVAFLLQHTSPAFRWQVSERVLTGFDGDSPLFSIDLTQHTIRTLLNALAAEPGVTVLSRASTEQLGLSACALIDESNSPSLSNGDRVHAFTSILWAYLESVAVELVEAKRRIGEALKQMSVKTAEAEWLDEWGGYFGFPRKEGEADAAYSQRIIAEVLRPRGNNKAIEIGLRDTFGQIASVVDVQRFSAGFPLYNGAITHNGVEQYDATSAPYYGLFKITIGYDLLGGADITGYLNEVRAYVETLRDAGTHLESVELGGSVLDDDFPFAPADVASALSMVASLADALDAPSEEFPLMPVIMAGVSEALSEPSETPVVEITYNVTYGGLRTFDGSVPFAGGTVESASLS